jgi:hypothetical protein
MGLGWFSIVLKIVKRLQAECGSAYVRKFLHQPTTKNFIPPIISYFLQMARFYYVNRPKSKKTPPYYRKILTSKTVRRQVCPEAAVRRAVASAIADIVLVGQLNGILFRGMALVVQFAPVYESESIFDTSKLLTGKVAQRLDEGKTGFEIGGNDGVFRLLTITGEGCKMVALCSRLSEVGRYVTQELWQIVVQRCSRDAGNDGVCRSRSLFDQGCG